MPIYATQRNTLHRERSTTVTQNENVMTIIELAAQMGRHKTGAIRYVRNLEQRLQQTFIREGRKDGSRLCLVVTKNDAKKILEHRKRDGFSNDGKTRLIR